MSEALSRLTSQPKTNMKTFCGRTTRSATFEGSAMAQFLGTSSPKTICTNVTMMNAPVVPAKATTCSGRPVIPNSELSSTPTDGAVR